MATSRRHETERTGMIGSVDPAVINVLLPAPSLLPTQRTEWPWGSVELLTDCNYVQNDIHFQQILSHSHTMQHHLVRYFVGQSLKANLKIKSKGDDD